MGVSSEDFGGDLDQGIMVAMSDHTHNFYIYNWKDIGACLEMDVCGVKAIPPFGDDSTPSTEGSGSGMTVVAVLLVAGVAAAIFKSKSQGGKMTSTSGESMYADDS